MSKDYLELILAAANQVLTGIVNNLMVTKLKSPGHMVIKPIDYKKTHNSDNKTDLNMSLPHGSELLRVFVMANTRTVSSMQQRKSSGECAGHNSA